MSLSQRVTIGLVVGLSLVAIIAMVLWLQRPEYALLFSDLDPGEAGRIVDHLRESNTPYRLERNGTAIFVPAKDVYELRLQLASQGLLTDGGVGYEIFDRTNLGTSEFVQKVNYHRALEGELVRTIQQLDVIERARVHIVIPPPSLFREDQKKATASVVLKLKGAGALDKAQIQGISYLVASSVEGLKPQDVMVIDTMGNPLSTSSMADPLVGLSAHQLGLQKEVERYLTNKAQGLLDGVLGAHNAIVQLSVALNFEQMESETETFDPDNAVPRSTEREEVVTYPDSGIASPDRTENEITNYEVGRTVQRIVGAMGDIKRLSAAVLLNRPYQIVTLEDGTQEKQYSVRTSEEMARLTNIIKSAIGFDASRGDQIEVTDIVFDTSVLDQEKAWFEKTETRQFWISVAKKAAIGLFALIFLVLLKSLINNLALKSAPRALLPTFEKEKFMEEPLEPSDREELFRASQRRSQRLEQIITLSKEKPEVVAEQLRLWMLEDFNQY